MQSYDDLETLADGFRATIDFIVNSNRVLRGEVADASGFIRQTIDMKCLNEPGRVAEIQTRVALALRALGSEGQPTTAIEEAIHAIAQRATAAVHPDLDPGSIEVVPAHIVSEGAALPADEPDEDDAEEDTDGEDEPLLEPAAHLCDDPDECPICNPDDEPDAEGYILGLQAQLRAHGIEPVKRESDYAYAITQSMALAAKEVVIDPPPPEPTHLPIDHPVRQAWLLAFAADDGGSSGGVPPSILEGLYPERELVVQRMGDGSEV